ncbi:MAG: ATP-binding protein [Planctomycetota bacterium]|jgi:hypothetical protein
MSTKKLRPWTDIVKLHPDVEAGALTESVFAIDLGAIAANDENVPLVNRDPEAFFRATYLTAELRKLLQEVLAALSGRTDFNRVIKLRTPFGGGKSHTLAALLHAVRARKGLKASPDVTDEGGVLTVQDEDAAEYGKPEILRRGVLPDPGKVDVAIFDGEKFDARDGKTLDDGPTIRTMWDWIAWQLGEDKYKLVEAHDRDRVSPGGDVIQKVLAGGPKLVLLDEVLKYMERAAAVAVHDSTLQRQAKDFFQNLTVEVAGSKNAALVYSLTWSAREALGNVGLLGEIDKLAARVDQLREPVTGDEILPILQRRLLGAPPPEEAADAVAGAYGDIVEGMRRAHADTPAARQQAEREGLLLRQRMRSAYPFHPALIDIMKERWCAVEDFQRTRGALRFLASCLHGLKGEGGARALLGPAEIPLGDAEVRVKMLKELGAQNDFDPVVTADIDGPNARVKRIDDRMARETPALASVRPATRLATAVFAYSFGGLRREGEEEGETLPSGVTEAELLAACVDPELDSITATAVLSEIRNTCLYLHHDGARYCFKKDPNVTKLVEDAEQDVARDQDAIRERIGEMLGERLAGKREAIIWPAQSHDVPDEEPRFLVGYMPLEFAGQTKAEQEDQAKAILTTYGDRPRKYRNGLGLAIPAKRQVEPLRHAVRYLMAVERVEANRRRLRLSKDQLDQLKERRRTEEAAAESAFRGLYASVWLPRVEKGRITIERVEARRRPLQATGVHERVMELLTGIGVPRVHGILKPHKVVERVKLGEPAAEGEPPLLGVRASEVRDAFFSSVEPPRLDSDNALRRAISEGLGDDKFAYVSGSVPKLGEDGKFQVNPEKVVLGRLLPEDEVDLDSGFLMVPSAVPEPEAVSTGGADPVVSPVGPPETGEVKPTTVGPEADGQTSVRMRFRATRDQVFKAFPAIANLADKADGRKVSIQIEAESEEGFDRSWLRNAVQEPLDEADIEQEPLDG